MEYLCLVYVCGEPQEGEPDFISETRYFSTLEEAERFRCETSDYGIYVDIFKGERI